MMERREFLAAAAGSASLPGDGRAPARRPLVFISCFAPGDRGAIQAFHLNEETGALHPAARSGGLEHPFYLAVAPNGRFLYAIHAPTFGGSEPEQVAAFAIQDDRGTLRPLNRQSTRGSASCYLMTDPTGRALLVANYTNGSVAALPVRRDGSLGEASSFHQHDGSSVNPTRQQGPHAHAIIPSPDGRFAFAADLGLDQVLCYRLEAPAGRLTPARAAFVRTAPGAGPRHLTFHPNGRHLYVINELSNSVTHFHYERETGRLSEAGTLSTLPAGYRETTHCADVRVTPDGRFLYGTNRGHDSLAAYRIADDGSLSLVEIRPSLGRGPQNLCVTARGRLLLCANMPGNNVAVFRIDGRTGRLTSAGDPVPLTAPSCVILHPGKA